MTTIRNLLHRLITWALGPTLDNFKREAVAAQQLAERAVEIADQARGIARTAEHRAQCITSMDVPIRRDHGVVTLTAVVRGKPIVEAYVIPPMTFDRVRELRNDLQYHYGAIDFVDAPGEVRRMLLL